MVLDNLEGEKIIGDPEPYHLGLGDHIKIKNPYKNESEISRQIQCGFLPIFKDLNVEDIAPLLKTLPEII